MYLPAQVRNNFLSFADNLYEEKEYYRAITEYKRYLFFFASTSHDSIIAMQKIVQCNLKGENYLDALSETNKLLSLHNISENQIVNWKAIRGLNFLKMKYLESAYNVFQDIKDSNYKNLFLGVAHFSQYEWDIADEYLSKVSVSPANSVLQLKQGLMDSSVRGLSLNYKNPLLAGILSGVLPGAGYAYVGKYQTAFSSLLLNSLLIGATIEFNKNGYKFAGGTTLLLAFGWYIGNIFGSFEAAESYNNNMSEGIVNPLLDKVNDYLFR